MQQESSPATGAIPDQPSPARGRHAAPAAPEDHPATDPPTRRVEGSPKPDETVVLPAFLTGKKEPPPTRTAPPLAPDGSLPPSERGMLIFVATLLGVGTLAVVVLLGLGGFTAPPAKATSSAVPVALPTPTPPEPSPAPSPTPSPTRSPVPPKPSPKRSPSPTSTFLGILTARDLSTFCSANHAGRVAQHSDRSWYCKSTTGHPSLPFSSTDICRWRYDDKAAWAVAGDIDDPTTWKCFT